VNVYPYECDAYGHLNEAAYLQLFERARWEILVRAAGSQLFRRQGVWPAVRHATVDYHLPVFPGDALDIDVNLEKLGRTSMTLRQRAVRKGDGMLVAEAQLVFVIIDSSGNPTTVPDEISELFATRVSTRSGEVVRYDVGEVTLAADVRGDGPALLLVHGFPLDRTIWKHQLGALQGWRRIAPDLRGMGQSDAPEAGYSMAAYADDLARLLDRLRVNKAVVAGLSMGGYIAFEMLRRHRNRVAGLVLCDTRAGADSEQGRKGREDMIALAQTQGAAAVAERMLPKLLGKSTHQTQPQVVAQVREMIVKTPVAGIVGALTAMRDRPDSTPLLAEIDVPALVVAGSEDELIPVADMRAMADAIPEAALTTIANAGHVPCLESPTAMTRVMAEFLEAVRQD
jgi:3-oxoadipate enol-lactonase